MHSLTNTLSALFEQAFTAAGFDADLGTVTVSNRPELSQFQCNGALPGAKRYKANPMHIAQQAVEKLETNGVFEKIEITPPGFINLTLTDRFLADFTSNLIDDPRQGLPAKETPKKIVVDYGGANVAKEMHAGHIRTAIVGECIKRLCKFAGDTVTGDVHLGDWGTQMGMLIEAVRKQQPNLPYFDDHFTGDYPTESPVTVAELGVLYPEASILCKSNDQEAQKARLATAALQEGKPGYRALWQHFVDVSIAALKRDYADLDVEFDLWNGESHAEPFVSDVVKKLEDSGIAYRDQGALICDVTPPKGKDDYAPLILKKADGASLYSTSDLATIFFRIKDGFDTMLYVVDDRQSQHFYQVFDVAKRGGIVTEDTALEHLAFGTINGTDGKPFKTRDGGKLRLRDLIDMADKAAFERLDEANVGQFDDAEKQEIAHAIGMAAVKFADMINHRTSAYIFDLEKFSRFEGKTGPAILYAAVRISSMLEKAHAQNIASGQLIAPESDAERQLMLMLNSCAREIHAAYTHRAPNYLCEFAYNLTSAFSRFYNDCHILDQTDTAKQASWLRLAEMTRAQLELVCSLIGLTIPKRM